jgi:hypothetical protein
MVAAKIQFRKYVRSRHGKRKMKEEEQKNK